MTALFTDYAAAVYSALDAVPALTGKIFEFVPNDAPFPKIYIEDAGTQDWSTMTDNGLEAEIALHVGSRYNGTKEIREFFNVIHDTLHNAELSTPDVDPVLCQFVRSDMTLDTDGKTRHGIIRFRLLISEV